MSPPNLISLEVVHTQDEVKTFVVPAGARS